MSMKEWCNKNLPSILTGASMVFTGATLILGVGAGVQIKEELDKLPEGTDTLEKVKVAAPYLIAPTLTAVGAAGCAYAANKENSARIAALAGTVALTQSENKYLETFKEKAEEKLGKKKTEEVREEVQEFHGVNHNQLVEFEDMETGFQFMSTREDFDRAVEMYNAEFNDMNEDDQREGLPISRFYEILLGTKYKHYAAHDDMGLKFDGVISLRPDKDGKVFKDGTLGWKFEYEWSNFTQPQLWIS